MNITQTLLSMWSFLLLEMLKTVIRIFDILDNTLFNIAQKDESEQ